MPTSRHSISVAPDAVPTINAWVSDRTNGRIPKLFDDIAQNEVLFLINAIYFKGKWRSAFDREDTQSEPFHGADGRDRTAFLMHQENPLPFRLTDDFQAVDLLYGNGAFAMTVLLPTAGRTAAGILSGLDAVRWRSITDCFSDAEVTLTLPRFRLDYGRRLNEDLRALGMGIAFDGSQADLYRIADVRPERLYITRVDQKTFVEVNEEGTEAAAATSVGVGTTSAPQVFTMRVDRPFVFAIRERLSGTVLFLGVMNVVGDSAAQLASGTMYCSFPLGASGIRSTISKTIRKSWPTPSSTDLVSRCCCASDGARRTLMRKRS